MVTNFNGLKNIPYIQLNIIYYIITYAALVGLGYFFVIESTPLTVSTQSCIFATCEG